MARSCIGAAGFLTGAARQETIRAAESCQLLMFGAVELDRLQVSQQLPTPHRHLASGANPGRTPAARPDSVDSPGYCVNSLSEHFARRLFAELGRDSRVRLKAP